MKITIDLPEETYKEIKLHGLYLCPRDCSALEKALSNSVVIDEVESPVEESKDWISLCSTQSMQYTYDRFKCPCCGHVSQFTSNFCPDCGWSRNGRKMRCDEIDADMMKGKTNDKRRND